MQPLHGAFLVLLIFGVSCRTAGSSSQTAAAGDSPTQEIGELESWFNDGTVAMPTFPIDHRVTHSLSDCGFRQGQKSPFIDRPATDAQPWYDSGQRVSYARVSSGNGCLADEYQKTDGATSPAECWKDFGLQFFNPTLPNAPPTLRVAGTSPVVRLIASDQYPSAATACAFMSDSALIWVVGVGNRGLGSGWETTSPAALAAITTWNRSINMPPAVGNDPAGHDKLKTLPGYIQIVSNDGTPRGSTTGSHDQHGIDMMAANFELAFRSGINHLEVVTHSNGMITAQIAYAAFARRMAEAFWTSPEVWGGSDWSPDLPTRLAIAKAAMIQDRQAHGGAEQMQINFYHLQAAPREPVSQAAKDSYGFTGDFVPFLAGTGASGEFTSYVDEELMRRFNLSFRYYYNQPDILTFDANPIVGRLISLKWHRALITSGVPIVMKHYACKDQRQDYCGPRHNQITSLEQFVNPAMKGSKAPMPWVRDAP